MARAKDERHRYGQHYTPHEVARLLAAFAVRSPGDLVFDPSCGDGRLLEEALKLKKQLSSGHRSDDSVLADHLFGVERSASAAHAARRTGACVAVADFFDVGPGTRLNTSTSLPGAFDAIIGNPPYIRHEVIGSRDKRRIETRVARDREASPEIFWPRWSRRSDIYLYFFARSIRFLKKGGRLVFLTASSWLDAGYGAALREWMLKNFRVIAVIESAAESFFTDASINTCITVLEREADPRARNETSIKFVRFNRALSEMLREDGVSRGRESDAAVRLARDIESAEASSSNQLSRIRIIAQSELLCDTAKEPQRIARAAIEQGWGKYLRANEVFFNIIACGSRLRSLSKMASVRFGVKTGANEFFYVTDAIEAADKVRPCKSPSRNGLLALGEVASVRRGITTGANEFFYLAHRWPNGDHRPAIESQPESRFLSPVVFSLKEIPGISLDRVAARRMLFNCSLPPHELVGTRALDYIESGERAGYHKRPTCSSREPWYSVAREMKPAPLIFPSKVGERWLVALNRARVFEDKKLYGIFPLLGVTETVLAALLNSTWARYYAEVTCRQMTGAQAIADIDVAVAEQIMLPDPRDLSTAMTTKLGEALSELSRRPIYSIFQEVKRADRRLLDSLTLEAIGLSDEQEREDVLDRLYDAVTELVRLRLSKSR